MIKFVLNEQSSFLGAVAGSAPEYFLACVLGRLLSGGAVVISKA